MWPTLDLHSRDLQHLLVRPTLLGVVLPHLPVGRKFSRFVLYDLLKDDES